MTPLDKTMLMQKIIIEVLDENAVDSGFKDWKDMREKNKIEPHKAYLIESLIREALKKYSIKLEEVKNG